MLSYVGCAIYRWEGWCIGVRCVVTADTYSACRGGSRKPRPAARAVDTIAARSDDGDDDDGDGDDDDDDGDDDDDDDHDNDDNDHDDDDNDHDDDDDK